MKEIYPLTYICILVNTLKELLEENKDLKIQLEYQKHLTKKYYNRWEFVEKQLRGKEKK
jgi:predicted GNAT family N-acyltransferase